MNIVCTVAAPLTTLTRPQSPPRSTLGVAATSLDTPPVHHQKFPIITRLHNTSYTVVLHIFIKGVATPSTSTVTLHGFLLYETTNTTMYVEPDHRRIQPRAMHTQLDPHPHVHLACANNFTRITLGPATDRFWRVTPHVLNFTHDYTLHQPDSCMVVVQGMEGVGMPLGPVLRDAMQHNAVGTNQQEHGLSASPVYLTLLGMQFA